MKKVTVNVPTEIQSIADKTQRVLQLIVDTAGSEKLARLVARVERDEEELKGMFRQLLKYL